MTYLEQMGIKIARVDSELAFLVIMERPDLKVDDVMAEGRRNLVYCWFLQYTGFLLPSAMLNSRNSAIGIDLDRHHSYRNCSRSPEYFAIISRIEDRAM